LSGRKKPPFEKRVLNFIRRHRLISEGEKIVVAVSGGPDSLCLLDILVKLRNELGISLHIAHLDHGLRGEDSAADARYVARFARRLGIPATIEARDVRNYQARNRLSLEEAAREVRYAFFGEVATAAGARRVAVGHTADDHVETVLMHLLRGSGTRGMRGLSPAVQWKTSRSGYTVIRPLLELMRGETIAYCRERHFSPRKDASNLFPDPFRNKIRLLLLPELEKYNPQIKDALLRTSRISADDLDFIESEAVRLKDRVVRLEKEAVVLDKKAFLALPVALKRHLLRDAITMILGNLKDIDASHIESILGAVSKPAGKTIELPEGLNFTIEYDRYTLSRNQSDLCPFPLIDNEVELRVPGKTIVSGGTIEASVISPSEKRTIPEADNFTVYLDYEKTGNRLALRRRKAGDRFQPLGLKKPKKLNEFMIDARIPRSWRTRIPIVTSSGQIIWVVGYRIDDRVKVTGETQQIIRLEFVRD